LHVPTTDDPLAGGLVLTLGQGLVLGEIEVGLGLASGSLGGQASQVFEGVDLTLN
jgi:hypothetical protein